MNKNSFLVFCILVLTPFSSCLRKELPAPAYQAGDEISSSASMGSDYSWQLYYKLSTNQIVGENLKDVWHLGFEASPKGFHVILNSAVSMFAYPTGKTDFASVVISDTTGKKRWDSPTGGLDSTAIGDWRTNGSVYIIDKGYSIGYIHQGFKKLQIISADETVYKIRYADLNGNNEQNIELEKDSAYNFIFLALKDKAEILKVEPPKKDWDIVFTQYTHVFYDLEQTYLVTGCLLNRYNTAAFMDSFVSFEEIDYARANSYTLSSFINTIGYDWKTVGSTGGGGSDYTVHSQMNYIIRSSEEEYFKLRFVDFYNDNKEKGNPKWEFQRL